MLVASAFLAAVSFVLAVLNFSEGDWNNLSLNIITLAVNIGLMFFWRRQLVNGA